MKKCLEKEEIREHTVIFRLEETLMCLNIDGESQEKEREKE